ncbi:hypothetical protein C2E23DRAFT_858168 [Lenzites betulinus]|nr:hypothetical protein C2E23DRAFT_858168 [Lenzites betulinus]
MELDSESSSASPPPIEPSSRRSSGSELPRKRRSKDGPNLLGGSMRDVARVLVSRERETMDVKRTLFTVSEQLKAERQRADAAEHKTREVLALFKSANEAKLAAEQEAARTSEALRLYKMQYQHAQEEIRRAQKLIDSLEQQRMDAEEAAAKARSMARKMKEETIIMSAREAGRRQGLEEGVAQGRVIGYEQGRAAGYEDGRADTERAFTERAYTEPYVEETPQRTTYRPPRVSRPSTSEDSEPNTRNYTQTMDETLPIPPPVTTPARIPTPAAAPVIPQQESKDHDMHPIPLHNAMMSPSHPAVDHPPDGWIPKVDDDNRIRLPPPHEMGPPPPTSPSPPLSAVLSNMRNIEDPPPVTIPPPAMEMRMPDPEPTSAPRRPRHRRRNSDESQSTTMSQFDLLNDPSYASSRTLRNTARDRPAVLSAIAEERERSSTVSSPVYGQPNPSTQSFQMPSPAPQMPTPSPNVPMPSPQPQPPNPSYPTPDSLGRYRSTDSLARSSVQDSRYAVPEPRTRSRASTTDDSHRQGSADDYYRSRPSDRTPRYTPAENVYRPAPPEATPRYAPAPPDPTPRYAPAPPEATPRYAPAPPEATPRYAPAPPEVTPRYDRRHVPEASPRYERPDDRLRSERSEPRNIYGEDSASRSGNMRDYSAHDPLHRSGSRSDLGRGAGGDPLSRVQNIYVPPHSPHSSPDSPAIRAPQPTLQLPHAHPQPSSNRGSMSSNEISFVVVPPSRPESNISRHDTDPHGSYLSADDADRPLPLLPQDEVADPSAQPSSPSQPVIPPPLGGPWPPPGFIPMGPPSPSQPGTHVYNGSIGPAGVPLPPSTVAGTPSVRSEVPIPGSFPGFNEGPSSGPVIPPISMQPSSRSSQSTTSRRAAKTKEPYSRSKVSRRDSDSDSSVSSSLDSSDPLTTPRARTRKISARSGRSTPAYAAAPIPDNIAYPTVPPTPRSSTSASLGSHTNRAARVPLPPSVAGSAIGSVVSPPGSTVGYGAAPAPLNHRSSIIGGRAPSETSRNRSPLMGNRSLLSPNHMPSPLPNEPVIPIPIPEPQPLPVAQFLPPSSPLMGMDRLGGFDDMATVPEVSRAPSPGLSGVTATTTGPKGKKTKKKGGKGGK